MMHSHIGLENTSVYGASVHKLSRPLDGAGAIQQTHRATTLGPSRNSSSGPSCLGGLTRRERNRRRHRLHQRTWLEKERGKDPHQDLVEERKRKRAEEPHGTTFKEAGLATSPRCSDSNARPHCLKHTAARARRAPARGAWGTQARVSTIARKERRRAERDQAHDAQRSFSQDATRQ